MSCYYPYNYNDEVEKDLRMVHQNGSHNHVPGLDSLQQAPRLSTLKNKPSQTWKTSRVEYPNGGGRKSVAKKEHVNANNKAQPNFTPMLDQDTYPGEEQHEDLESVDC